MVSIIIAVYNTEKYLHKCINSLLEQTYQDIEVIIINDGSTDQSEKICNMYADKDYRIKVFSQANAGQGAARNLGLSKASGEFIMFVDSDDWVDKHIVEELMNSLISSESDIAICNYYRTKINSEEILGCCEEKISKKCIEKKDDKNYVFNISSFPCFKLFRRSLLNKSLFRFPEHFFEDVAAIPLLFAYADKISYVNKPLYYYRNHTKSTVNTLARVDDRVKCLYSLVALFKKHGLFEEYRDEMQEYIKKRIKINARMAKRVLYLYENEFNKKQDDFYKAHFGGQSKYKVPNILAFGSYNLYTITKILMNSDPDQILSEYYGFQSIVSLMNKQNNALNYINVQHPVEFRKKGIISDLTNKLIHKSVMEFQDIDYVLIDFLEERYGIARWDKNYFTLSEAFKEASVYPKIEYETIERNSDEGFELWKKSCNEFIQVLKKYIDPHKIVLVRMKLAEYYGRDGKEKEYTEIEAIQKQNHMLDCYYDYFMEKCPEACDIGELIDKPDYYTHSEFRHGCYPWHLGESNYIKISKEVAEQMKYFK